MNRHFHRAFRFGLCCLFLATTALAASKSAIAQPDESAAETLATSARTGTDRLPTPVASALKNAGIPLSAVSVVVQEAGSASPKINVNGDQPRNPASVMKLLTTYAALEILGPAYTWKTDALTESPPVHGSIQNLYLKGSGDPKFHLEHFWLLLRQLRARGVQEIRGDLILDRSAFAVGEHDESAFDGKPSRPYNVGPDALLLNFKAIRLSLLPESSHVTVLAEPEPVNLEIVNQLSLHGGACPGDTAWREGLSAETTRLTEAPGRKYRLTLSGDFPAACGEKTWNVGALPHQDYVFGVFQQLWKELGGQFQGQVRDGKTPNGANRIGRVTSPALSEIIRDINKFSNNVMARQVFLTLSQANSEGESGSKTVATSASADAAVRAWLSDKSLTFPELVLDNGSGLSRRERISAINLARLLNQAWSSPTMPELMASLPLTAVDGTMRKRLRNGRVAGQSHIKTGSLDGVKTMAGYLLDNAGRRQIVVFLVNHPNAAAAQAAQDALLQWVYDRSAKSD